MKVFGLARIGRDAEIRKTPNGDSVAGLSLAFTYHNKGEKCTQWVDAAIWGKRADALAPYLLKGGLVSVTLEGVHIETFRKQDGGDATKLTGRVMDIELAGGRHEDQAKPAAPRQDKAEAWKAGAPKPAPVEFDDGGDSIPF